MKLYSDIQNMINQKLNILSQTNKINKKMETFSFSKYATSQQKQKLDELYESNKKLQSELTLSQFKFNEKNILSQKLETLQNSINSLANELNGSQSAKIENNQKAQNVIKILEDYGDEQQIEEFKKDYTNELLNVIQNIKQKYITNCNRKLSLQQHKENLLQENYNSCNQHISELENELNLFHKKKIEDYNNLKQKLKTLDAQKQKTQITFSFNKKEIENIHNKISDKFKCNCNSKLNFLSKSNLKINDEIKRLTGKLNTFNFSSQNKNKVLSYLKSLKNIQNQSELESLQKKLSNHIQLINQIKQNKKQFNFKMNSIIKKFYNSKSPSYRLKLKQKKQLLKFNFQKLHSTLMKKLENI